jgi:hypothetical protein
MEELKEFRLCDMYDRLRWTDEEFTDWFKQLGLLHSKRTCVCGVRNQT